MAGHGAFSETYAEARDKFRAAATVAGAELTTLLVCEPDYTIDCALLRGSQPGLVVHSSGVHGAEGFAGSAIQVQALQSYADSRPSLSVCFVHAVNPHGMAHYRRWNENNVDLNRNALDAAGWAEVKARDPNIAGYEDFKDFLNPRTSVRGAYANVVLWLRALWLILRHGVTHMKRAMVAGTYTHADGIFYGGQGLEKSHELLEQYVRSKLLAVPGKVTWVDVHTGLGPSGVDSLLVDADLKSRMGSFFDGGETLCVDDGEASSGGQAAGYELSCGFMSAYYPKLFTEPCSLITEEFGTLPTVFVARAMIVENAGFQHDRENHDHWRTFTRDAFYVRTPAWKQAVLARGITVLGQAVHFTQCPSRL